MNSSIAGTSVRSAGIVTAVLIALFCVNSAMASANPIALVILCAALLLSRGYNRRVLIIAVLPILLLALTTLLQALVSDKDETYLTPAKYIALLSIYGCGFGYLLGHEGRKLSEALFAKLLFGFVFLHAAWSVVFVMAAPVERIVSVEGFTLQRHNMQGLVVLRFWEYENQVIGITYFTVLPLACVWMFLRPNVGRAMKIALLLAGAVAAWCSGRFVTRMPLVISAIAFAVYFLWSARLSSRLMRSCAILLVAVAVGSMAVAGLMPHVPLIEEYSKRFTGSADFGRIDIWINAAEVIASNPQGGSRGAMVAGDFAHNCMLDWMIDYGWFIGGAWSFALLFYCAWITARMLRKQITESIPELSLVLWSVGSVATLLIDPPTYPRMVYIIASAVAVYTYSIRKNAQRDSEFPRRF